MKIIVDNAIPYIKDRFPEKVEVMYVPGKEFTPEMIKDADALIVRTRTKCNGDLLAGSSVKLIFTATIGTDHIDIPWCEKNGIIVKNAPGCNAPGVAQYLFSSLFKTGFDPEKHVLGIIGYGNVGQIVADWANAMEIKTLISDPPRQEHGWKDVEYFDLDYILKNSDAVTLHVPLTNEGKYPTYKLIGEKEIGMMKPGAVLVNSSRGGVVDEKALKGALIENKLKAILDVWENEPNIDVELVGLVSIATPHIAGYSEEGKKRATRMALEDMSAILGVNTEIKGLECRAPENKKITRKLIEDSYNPFEDDKNLRENLSRFEELRNQYSYRHEPFFI